MDEWIKKIDKEKWEEVWDKYKNAKDNEERINILYSNHPDGLVNLEPIKHLDDYLKCMRLVSNSSTWFRGESREHEFLIPKLYRGIEETEIHSVLKKERKYFQEFRRRARSIVPRFEQDDIWSWYFLIQHHGGPTRLLDWTSNAAIALFMAIDTSRDKTDNPVVYFLAPAVLTNYAFKDTDFESDETGRVLYPGEDNTDKWISNLNNNNLEIPESPIALLPAYSCERIVAQKSCFTLFGKRLNGFVKDGKQIICPCCDRRILHKVIIDGNSKEILRNELSKIGVSSETTYPGLDGLTKEMNQEIFGVKK
jgi:hypothetical protein